ncbi:transcriptional regulator, partial [Serratia sp. CY74664]
MRYIINNNIKYHEDRSELISLHDDIPPIALTATLNRLLSALVRNNNLVLSRETLLTQVWEAHGQVASGNNLNNTISILRKAFSSLGEEDIIVTLPRQGFMFTATELKTTDSLAEMLMVQNAAPVGKAVPFAEPAVRLMRFKHIMLGGLLLLAVGMSLWAWQDADYEPLSAMKVGNIGSCEIKFVTSYHKPGPGEVDLSHLKSLLEQKNIPCDVPATVLYYDSKFILPNATGRIRSSYFYYCPQVKMA